MVYVIYDIYGMYDKDSKNIILTPKINSSGCACLGAVFTRALMLTSRACALRRKLRHTILHSSSSL